jgi:hypothetical protein
MRPIMTETLVRSHWLLDVAHGCGLTTSEPALESCASIADVWRMVARSSRARTICWRSARPTARSSLRAQIRPTSRASTSSPSPVRLDEAARGHQAEAGSARCGREEGCDDLFAHVRRDTGPFVRERDLTGVIVRSHRDADLPLPLHGLGAVDQHVVKDDLKQTRVGHDGLGNAFDEDPDVAGARILLQEIGRAAKQLNDVGRLGAWLRRTRKGQQVLHQRGERIDP